MPRQRRFSRLAFRAAATLTLDPRHAGLASEVVDLSLKGALVTRPAGLDVPPGTELELNVHLADSPERIVMKTTVAHVTRGRIGLRCVSIDVDSMIHLRRLMELNLGDPALLERELISLG